MGLRTLAVLDQLKVLDGRVHDPRGSIPTGYPELDALLYRGGLTPGTLTLWAGRTQTRKSAAMYNMMVNISAQRIPVGFIALDETPAMVVAKLMSVLTGWSHEYIEDQWDEKDGKHARALYEETMTNFAIGTGGRPNEEDLDAWLNYPDQKPSVVFLDYLSLVYRNSYDGGETQRIQRAAEMLQTWKNKHDVALVALHQVGRQDHFSASGVYNGDTPLALESLKYGGEEPADIVLGNYRPARNELGNMDQANAQAVMGDKFDEDVYYWWRDRVKRYRNSTLLQVLKNRPGTKVTGEGYDDIELKSFGDSQKMVTDGQKVDEDGVMQNG